MFEGNAVCSNLVNNFLCDDSDLCTIDTCVPFDKTTFNCEYEDVDCDDGDKCTMDMCNPDDGLCIFQDVVCNDDNKCTMDMCNPNDGSCIFTNICDDPPPNPRPKKSAP